MLTRKITRKIVTHYSLSDDVPASVIRSWHLARGWNDIGYHYVIRRDGTVEKGRDERFIGAHTKRHNYDSIGICLTGADNKKWYPSPAQLASWQGLVRQLMQKYNISAKMATYLHRELFPTRCPGRLKKEMLVKLLGVPPIKELPSPIKLPPRGHQHERPALPLLRLGSRGNAVYLLQQRLGIHLVPVRIDGIFGPKTLKAVKKFQKAHGLAVDGIVGPKTWKLLMQPRGK